MLARLAPSWRRSGGAALVAALLLAGSPAIAQNQPAPASAVAVPDRVETAQLVWSTLIALDQANRTGNYSVLRDLGSRTFREANTPASLAEVFRQLRREDIGLGRTVQLVPVYDEPPTITDEGRLRIAGSFAIRPVGIRFNLEFESANGAWLIYNIGIGPQEAVDPQAASPQAEGTSQ